jgi:hypothetical protein
MKSKRGKVSGTKEGLVGSAKGCRWNSAIWVVSAFGSVYILVNGVQELGWSVEGYTGIVARAASISTNIEMFLCFNSITANP